MIHVSTTGSHAIAIAVANELDMAATPYVEDLVDKARRVDCKALTIDLTACPYIDSSAIALFVRLSKKDWTDFAVEVPARGPIYRVLDICGFLQGKTFVRVVGHDPGSCVT